jgi:hypothetical protein
LSTSDLIEQYHISPPDSVRQLTARISRALDEHVFQSENFSERELILLLEKIYHEDKKTTSWNLRFDRLKQFENGLKALRSTNFHDIERLRFLLLRHQKTNNRFEILQGPGGVEYHRSLKRFVLFVCGFPAALLGRLLTVIPYQLVNVIVKHIKMYDESQAATHKISYALFFYPVAFVLETVLVLLWLGWFAALLFSIAVIPLSYFSLYFFEWLHEGGLGIRLPPSRIKKRLEHYLSRQIEREKGQIVKRVDKLAAVVVHPNRENIKPEKDR